MNVGQQILSTKEKNAIKDSPCGQCGAVPIIEKGERCHPHRIKPGRVGGLYTKDNTVPRCYSCHDVEEGGDGTAPFIGAARAAGRKGGLKGWSTPERHAKHCAAMNNPMNNPEVKAKHSAVMKEVIKRPGILVATLARLEVAWERSSEKAWRRAEERLAQQRKSA